MPQRRVAGKGPLPSSPRRQQGALIPAYNLGGLLSSPEERSAAVFSQLRGLRNKVPTPGDVLRFSQSSKLLLGTNQKDIFIRGCYKPLFETLLVSEANKDILTGTPGIGKSFFVEYALARLVALPEPPPYIVWQDHAVPNDVWCYYHATGKVRMGTLTTFFAELSHPKAWYIVDGMEPMVGARAHTVLVTSPSYTKQKEMEKAGARILCMPRWELAELLECRAQVYDSSVPEELVVKAYEHFGGVARYALGVPSQMQRIKDPEERFEKLLRVLNQALDRCDPDQVRRGIGALEVGPEASLRIFHLIADANLELSHLDFASPWVAKAFVERVLRNNYDTLMSYTACTTGAIRGYLHELLMHQVFPKGGHFTVMSINRRTLSCSKVERQLELPACTVESFKDAAEIKDKNGRIRGGVYFKPEQSNFPTIDSLLLVGGTLHMFSMAVSRKEISEDALTKLYSNRLGIQATDYKELKLYFVVPPDVFKSFKPDKVAGSWPPSKGSDAALTSLHVMEGYIYDDATMAQLPRK